MLNPVSPNSDQHQISPCKVIACFTSEVMRIKKMIIQGEFSDWLPELSESSSSYDGLLALQLMFRGSKVL